MRRTRVEVDAAQYFGRRGRGCGAGQRLATVHSAIVWDAASGSFWIRWRRYQTVHTVSPP